MSVCDRVRDRVPASPLRGDGRSGTQSLTTASDAVGRSQAIL